MQLIKISNSSTSGIVPHG